MTTICHVFPGVTPHGPEVSCSIWNLPYSTWLGFAQFADDYVAARKES